MLDEEGKGKAEDMDPALYFRENICKERKKHHHFTETVQRFSQFEKKGKRDPQ